MSARHPDRLVARTDLCVALYVALAAASLYMVAALSRDFWSPDEPDFAEHVREMRLRGSYLLPYENGRPYSEKPILFYWAVSATTATGGGEIHPGASRLPSVLAGAFLVFGAAALAGRRGGRREALLAGAATAVAPIVFWQSQFLQIDALFSALVLGLFLSEWLVDDDPENAAGWTWLFHLLLPLAVLTKGPLAVVLAGLVAASRAFFERSWRPVLVLRPLRGALVFLAVAVPWFTAASLAGGREYAYDLIVNQNWNRFFHSFDHVQPFWFYLESIWGDFFPWTLPALLAPIILFRSGLLERRPELKFSGLVAATVFLFLSASGSKQGKYLLVAYPFAAVLLAAGVGALERPGPEGSPAGLRKARSYALFVAALLLGGAFALRPVALSKAPGFARLALFVAFPLAAGAVGTGVTLVRRAKEASPAFLALAATLAAGEAAVAATVFPAVDVLKTGRPFYERIRPLVSHGEPLAYFGETYHCYPILVLKRRTEHFKTQEALASWIEETPGALVLVDESLVRTWTNRTLHTLKILDRQRVGQDATYLLGRP